MDKRIPVIIPVETKSREFHGKLFLALHLLCAGHPVMFGEQGRLWDYADLIRPGVWFDKSVATTRADWFRRFRKMGHEVVSWDEEGLVFFDSWLYRKQRIDPRSFDLVSLFFAWGAVQRDAICEEYPEYRGKISLCGNPRFDFLREELRSFYNPTVCELKKRFGPMLLINTNFAFHNHFKETTELQRMLAQYPVNNEPGYMEKWIDMHREMHECYLKMVPALLDRYPEHTIVVRPHPSESHVPWLELSRMHPRLHVDASGNVHEWILASEAIVHFNCTTAVEAYLLGVPAIAYRPYRYPRYENKLPNALSENAFSIEELYQSLDGRKTARERGTLWTSEQDRLVAEYVTSLSGPTAAERVAKLVTEFASRCYTPKTSLNKFIISRLKHTWRLYLHAARELKKPPDGYIKQKFPGLMEDEIREALARMVDISGINPSYRVRSFAKNCFWLIPHDCG